MELCYSSNFKAGDIAVQISFMSLSRLSINTLSVVVSLYCMVEWMLVMVTWDWFLNVELRYGLMFVVFHF